MLSLLALFGLCCGEAINAQGSGLLHHRNAELAGVRIRQPG
jgi:hypothetical protein